MTYLLIKLTFHNDRYIFQVEKGMIIEIILIYKIQSNPTKCPQPLNDKLSVIRGNIEWKPTK